MKTSSDTEQLATVEEVKNMVRSSSGGLGGRLIGTYKFKRVNSCDPATIKLKTPADYLIVNVISGNCTISRSDEYSDKYAIAYATSTNINSTIVCKGGSAYIPSTYGDDSDSDNQPEYCVDAFCSMSTSLSDDGLTITNASNSSNYSPAIGTIEVYSFT